MSTALWRLAADTPVLIEGGQRVRAYATIAYGPPTATGVRPIVGYRAAWGRDQGRVNEPFGPVFSSQRELLAFLWLINGEAT